MPPWSWPPYEEMEEECRLKGKGLETGLWLHSPQRKTHSGNCSVHENNEGVYIIHLQARNTLGWGGGKGRKRQRIKVLKRTVPSLCVFLCKRTRVEVRIWIGSGKLSKRAIHTDITVLTNWSPIRNQSLGVWKMVRCSGGEKDHDKSCQITNQSDLLDFCKHSFD